MKKLLALFTFSLLLLSPSLESQALTIKSGKDYLPQDGYRYTYVYTPSTQLLRTKVTCEGTKTAVSCYDKNIMGLGYSYYQKQYVVTMNHSKTLFQQPIQFPLKKGKVYRQTEVYENGDRYTYHYKLMKAPFKKKIGSKTYKEVLKIEYDYGQGSKSYTYLAKHHGIILSNTSDEIWFKVTNYTKR